MSRIVFQIGRESPWHRNIPGWSYFFGDSLKKALGDPCVVSLQVDGQTIDKRRTTGWGQELTPTDVLSFLGHYRNEPGKTNPEQAIREAFHHFLFAQRVFDGPVGGLLAQDIGGHERSEILIRGDSSSLPLIINIPWELAEAVQTSTTRAHHEPTLAGTLAAFLLARVINNTRAQLSSVRERLRVLYCISQPPTLDSIQASDFHSGLEDALKARSGMLSYQAVIDDDFTPSFNQLRAGIEHTQPHVLIIACHGQTLDGVPQLCFEEWHPVSSLANALAQNAKTFLVVLIACDQTHLDEHPAAHSGAVTLLEEGILAVVAMQSSVSALLAKEFLGTTLDWFFKSGAIALSVAEGRKSMAPTASAADKRVDWSFPALFLSEDAPQHTDKLTRIIEAYFPTLDEMLRRIPRPEPYLQRPEFDQPLSEFMRVGVAGLREVTGAAYTGKTTVVLNACRKALERAIEKNDTSTRPLLYVDFGRYSETPNTARELMEILRKQTEEIQSTAAGTPLLSWTSPRGADGEPGTHDSTGQLAAFIDLNRMVLILDNLQETDDPFWSEVFDRVKSLNHSLVIRVSETAAQNIAGDLKILPFTRAQTEEYVRCFAAEHIAAARDWFDWTGGLPGLLDLLRKSDGDGEVVYMSASLFTKNLPEAEQDILYTLANLPNGVDPELASLFVEADLRDLLRLAQKGLLLRESRFGITSSWFRLPRLLMQALQSDPERTTDAAISLADKFGDRVGSDTTLSVTDVLVNLAARPGGIDFVQDIHQVLIKVEYWEEARVLPLLLHKSLFSKGRWYETFRLWNRLLSNTPFGESEAHEWLKLAKVAHILGFGDKASAFIARAEERKLTRLDEIDIRIQFAAIIKDTGDASRANEVTDLYEEILNLIEAGKIGPSDPGTDEIKESDLAERHALTIHNRALHRRYWLRDLAGALSDLDQAAVEFGKLGDARMKGVSDLEWAEIQLDWSEHEKHWDEMLRRLIQSSKTFESMGAVGDSGFCYYQLARYFRRKPFSTSQESKTNNFRARDAYRRSSECASLAGDSRLKEIAEGHLVEVCWLELGEIEAAESSERLERVVSVLRTYEGDAWSSRVTRDMLRLGARALLALKANNALELFKAAWDAANKPPLHPSYGADAKRTARILSEYLEELEKNHQALEADRVSVIAKDCIQQWLDRIIDPLNRESWIEEVRQYGAG